MVVMQSSLNWLAPVVPFVASNAVYALALRSYRERWLWLAPLLYCHYLSLLGSSYWPAGGLDSLWALLICIWTSHSVSLLFLEDHAFQVDGRGAFEKQTWYWKYWISWNNVRLLFTSRAENRTRRLTASCEGQSRYSFAAHRVAKLALYWAWNNHIQAHVLPGPFVPLYAADFDPTRQVFFRRILLDQQNPVTLREVALRAVFALFWAVGGYVLVDGAHSALSLFFVVVLRVNKPHEWPPIYGSLRHAHSLRGFWGKFWHRLVVIPYGNIGKLLAERCLGFQPASLPHKLIVACAIFVISGMSHAVAAWQLGDHACWHLDIWWFFLNFVASAAESAVSFKLSRKTGLYDAPRSGIQALLDNSIVRKCLGFAWVFLFFFWSVPKWQYPKLYSMITTEFPSSEDSHI